MTPTKSPCFYTENLVIQVQEMLFSVPKHVLVLPGTSFESTLLLPSSPSVVDHPETGIEGKSDDNPIRLAASITALQFSHFLSFVYTHSGRAGPVPSTFDDWMGVYNLAAMWSFESVQGVASTAIKSQVIAKGGLECMQLGQKYDVDQWIKRGIYLLIQQPSPPDRKGMEDGGLSLKTICAIYEARDRAVVGVMVKVYTPSNYPHPYTNTAYLKKEGPGTERAVEEIFASEYAAYGGLGKESLFL